eukprot:6070729-Prymnesium_polylepis.3
MPARRRGRQQQLSRVGGRRRVPGAPGRTLAHLSSEPESTTSGVRAEQKTAALLAVGAANEGEIRSTPMAEPWPPRGYTRGYTRIALRDSRRGAPVSFQRKSTADTRRVVLARPPPVTVALVLLCPGARRRRGAAAAAAVAALLLLGRARDLREVPNLEQCVAAAADRHVAEARDGVHGVRVLRQVADQPGAALPLLAERPDAQAPVECRAADDAVAAQRDGSQLALGIERTDQAERVRSWAGGTTMSGRAARR